MTTAQALTAGGAARAAGQPSTSCPHGDDAPELRRAWVTGWVRARTADLFGALPHRA